MPAIGAIAAVAGGAIAAGGARGAAKAQTASADRASATQLQMFEQSRADQAPWRQAGQGGLNELAIRMGIAPSHTQSSAHKDDPNFGSFLKSFTADDFTKDPGYDFRLEEGMKGLTNSAAARGGLLSGEALKAASRFNQDFASNEYGNAYNRFNNNQTNQFNRLASLSGVGQTAATQIGQQGISTGNQIAQNQMGAGNARASSYIAQGNAWNNAIGTGVNAWQQNTLLSQNPAGFNWSGRGGFGDSYSTSWGE